MCLHASNISMAVAVMFPGDLLQQPVTPVQKAANTARKLIMKSAIMDRPISKNNFSFIIVTRK